MEIAIDMLRDLRMFMQLNPSGNIHINNTVRDYSSSGNHHFKVDLKSEDL